MHLPLRHRRHSHVNLSVYAITCEHKSSVLVLMPKDEQEVTCTCTHASLRHTPPMCTHMNILLPKGEVSSPISQDSESGKKVMAGGMPEDFSSTTLGTKVHQGFWRMMGVIPVPARLR